MKITIQYIDACPNWRLAENRVKSVLRALDWGHVEVAHQLIDSAETARRARFRGSPTILIDGSDPFGEGGQPFGLSCRLYQTETGLQGAPTEAQLSLALVRTT